MFANTLPTWFPKDISECFNKTALIPKINSGRVVIIEIKSNPTKIWETAKFNAISFAYKTANFEEKKRTKTEITNINQGKMLCFPLTFFGFVFIGDFLFFLNVIKILMQNKETKIIPSVREREFPIK